MPGAAELAAASDRPVGVVARSSGGVYFARPPAQPGRRMSGQMLCRSMNRLALLIFCLLLTGCDSQDEPAGPDSLRASVNGQPLDFTLSVAVKTADGGASWGGVYCVPNRPPRNLAVGLFISDPQRGTYSVGPGGGELFVGESSGDGDVGSYRPSETRGASITVESYDARSGRLRGRFSGTFAVEPGSDPQFRLFPDMLVVTDGVFNLSLVPINESEPAQEYPCP